MTKPNPSCINCNYRGHEVTPCEGGALCGDYKPSKRLSGEYQDKLRKKAER